MTARALPDWPRMMRRSLAASYAGYSGPEFDKAVASAEMPDAIRTVAGERWDRRTIDTALDQLTGGGVPVDWRGEARSRMGVSG